MGQNVSTTQRQKLRPREKSKHELLYEAAVKGDNDTVKILWRKGASLEWRDHEGRTPLIVACMTHGLYTTADTLTELGADINASSPGYHGGTPLHHAARRGLIDIVKLLLSKGANALLMNDNNRTADAIARAADHLNVIRTIERHICFFSGWMLELRAPGFLEAVAPKFRSKKIWVVVLPCTNNSLSPFVELLIYNNSWELYPRSVICLWKANIGKPKFHKSYYALKIVDKPTGTHYKLAPAVDVDKQHIQSFYNACVGIPKTVLPVVRDTRTSIDWTVSTEEEEATELAMALSASVQSTSEDRASLPSTVDFTSNAEEAAELALAISGSVQSATQQEQRTALPSDNHRALETINTDYGGNSSDTSYHYGWDTSAGPILATSSQLIDYGSTKERNGQDAASTGVHIDLTKHTVSQDIIQLITETNKGIPAMFPANPSAPPIPEDFDDGLLHIPSIDLSPDSMPNPVLSDVGGASNVREGGSSSCIICCEAPVEGACIPCGHMAGCISCLNEIKVKDGFCPVCWEDVERVLRLYAV